MLFKNCGRTDGHTDDADDAFSSGELTSGDPEKEVAEHDPTMTDNQPDPGQEEAHLSNSHVESPPNRAPKSLDFFQSHTITKAIVKKPKAKSVPPFLAGNLLK